MSKKLKSAVKQLLHHVSELNVRVTKLEYPPKKEIELLEEKKDKFAELKEAHSNGKVIQLNSIYNGWHDVEDDSDLWLPTYEYRIKPEEKPKVGDVCKFWIGNEEDYFVGVLDSISGVHNDYIVRFSKTGSKFCSYLKARHAKKLNKEEAIDLLFNK